MQLGKMFARLIDREPDFSIQLDIGKDEKSSDKKIAVLAPGVGWNSKRAWPLENFLQTAEHLRKKKFQVVWVEGPYDGNVFEEFPEKLQKERRAFPADALLSLTRQLSRADLVVCNDTLYAHLAAALDRPTVAIYGAGQESRFFPRRGRVKVVQGAIPCSGCQWYCIFDRMVCVQDIPVNTVLQAIDSVIDKGDYKTKTEPIKLPSDNGQGAALETIRDRLQESWMREFWDNWTRLQMLHRAGDEIEKAEAHRLARQEAFKNLERVIRDIDADRIALQEALRKNDADRTALHKSAAERLEAIRNLEELVKKREEELVFFKHIIYRPIAMFKFWGNLLRKDMLRLGRRLRFWKK